MIDIDNTIDALTTDTGKPLIVATDVERFVLSPITFWCELHAPAEQQDPLPLYLEHLFTVGHDHQENVVNEFHPDAVQEVFYDQEEGLRLTLELMSRGQSAIKNMPLISRPLGLEGRPDLLIKVNDVASELGPFSYCVVEIKSARNIQREHILQGAVYNRLLGAIQGYEPPQFYLINRDRATQTIRMDDISDELDDVLREMREVINGKAIEACHGAGKWPWESYVDSLAIAVNDVSLIPGVGAVRREALISAGFKSVNALANAQVDSLTRVKGVGPPTATRFITSAQAIRDGHPVRRDTTLQMAHSKTEVFLDFEGTDPRIGADGLEVVNYLIGALVRSPSQPAIFVPFFVESFEDQEPVLRRFLEWGSSLDDVLFYHWSNYERTHLKKMTDYFGVTKAQASPVIDRLVDLYPITTKSFAFPTYGEGLKEIAKYLGFHWRQGDVDALTSVALYFKYRDSDGTNKKARQKILDYNEDDCLATMHVFDWLSSQQAQARGAISRVWAVR